MTRPNRFLAAVAAAVLVAGCPSGAAVSDIAAGSAATLRADVLALSQAASQRDWVAARAALQKLRADLDTAVKSGDLSAERAQRIRTDVTAVATDIALHMTPATTTPTPTPTKTKITKPAPAPKHKRHSGKGPGGGGED